MREPEEAVAGCGRKEESGWIFAPREGLVSKSAKRIRWEVCALTKAYWSCGIRGPPAGRCGLDLPGRLLAGKTARVRDRIYLLVDIDDDIVASVRHAGVIRSWLCRELAVALAASLLLTFRVSQGPSADWLHGDASHPYLQFSRQELLYQMKTHQESTRSQTDGTCTCTK